MTTSPAFQSQDALKPLPFDPSKLTGLSERMIRSHWENNYGGSVKALAAVKARLVQAAGDKDLPPYIYNDLKREHLIRTGSVVLHELYFENLGAVARPQLPSERRSLKPSAASKTGRGNSAASVPASVGSGWVVLGFNLHTRQLENYWMADHAHGPAATVPILVMDMYEHSYQMDYGAAAAKYIDAFFQNIQWESVSARLAGARAI